jgi:hypothetical protein
MEFSLYLWEEYPKGVSEDILDHIADDVPISPNNVAFGGTHVYVAFPGASVAKVEKRQCQGSSVEIIDQASVTAEIKEMLAFSQFTLYFPKHWQKHVRNACNNHRKKYGKFSTKLVGNFLQVRKVLAPNAEV